MGKMQPYFEKRFVEKGFKVVVWTLAGWIHFFTKQPATTPDELKKLKIGFSTGEPDIEQAWKRMGYHVVPTRMKDLLMALQSGMVEACYLPPLLAGMGQYFALVPHMNDMRVMPLIGAIVISDKVWNKIPSEYHQPMMDYCDSLTDELYQTVLDLEAEAVESMKEHGLVIDTPAPEAIPEWIELVRQGVEGMIGKTFSKETYDLILEHLNDYRKTSRTLQP
jgi:TRAP-type C4-dicarboxylate transport system substrate-binding protein